MRLGRRRGRWRRERRASDRSGRSPAVTPPGRASAGRPSGTDGGTGVPGATAAAPKPSPGEHVAVLLDPALEPVAAALREELGPGFAVVVWAPGDREGERGDSAYGLPVKPVQGVISVLDLAADPTAAAGVAHPRRRQPRAGMLVVASRSAAAASWQATTELLDAGADDVLTELNTRELAARLKALARRRTASLAPS